MNQVFDLIVQGLITDGKVNIVNFGTFEKQIIPPYEGVHPVTGEKIQIDSHHRIRFVSSNKIKSSSNKGGAFPTNAPLFTFPNSGKENQNSGKNIVEHMNGNRNQDIAFRFFINIA